MRLTFGQMPLVVVSDPGTDSVPAAFEIRSMDLRAGRALVALGSIVPARLDRSYVRVRMGWVRGPDGWYVLSVAQVRSP